MKPKLCAAGTTLRNQINERFSDRLKDSDGWVADARHMSAGTSDHIPDAKTGIVRGLDTDRDLSGKAKPDLMPYLADQLRICAKKDKRISYVIFDRKIASAKSLWRWRTYRGVNPHVKHCHVSFNKTGDLDPRPFNIPLLEN